LNGSGGAWKSSDNEFVRIANRDNLIGIGGDGLNAGNAEGVIIQVDNLSNFTLNRGDNRGNIGYGGGFG
jgi:hypothetical protein